MVFLYRSSAEHSEGHPVYAPHPYMYKTARLVQVQRVWPSSMTPPCTQPHSVFGDLISLSGGLLCHELILINMADIIPTQQAITTLSVLSQHRRVLVAFDRGKIIPTQQDITTFNCSLSVLAQHQQVMVTFARVHQFSSRWHLSARESP